MSTYRKTDTTVAYTAKHYFAIQRNEPPMYTTKRTNCKRSHKV